MSKGTLEPLLRCGDRDAAAQAFRAARPLASDAAERRHLDRRIAATDPA